MHPARLIPGSIRNRLLRKWKYLVFRGHTLLGRSRLLLCVYRVFGINQQLVVKPGTQLVIEGAARTATTFTYHGIQVSQPSPLAIAYHTHLPGQVLRAIDLERPILVTIRAPRDAVASAIVREPFMPTRAYLERYFHFYQVLLPHMGSFLVADFDELVNDFPAIVRRLNDRFGLTLAVPQDPKGFYGKVVARMQGHHKAFGGGEHQSYLPNAAKADAKKRVDFRSETALLARCEALYQVYVDAAR